MPVSQPLGLYSGGGRGGRGLRDGVLHLTLRTLFSVWLYFDT